MKLTPFLDICHIWVRSRLYRARGRAVQVVLGSGRLPLGDRWIGTDIEVLDIADRQGWQRLFAPDSLDALLAEHVWEHLEPEQARAAAKNCFRFLKPGGYLRVAVPDGCHPSSDYRERVRPGGSGPGSEDHKTLYDYRSLSLLFSEAGFTVRLLEHFDEQGEFHDNGLDHEKGPIKRCRANDPRNQNGTLVYTSLILDACKEPAQPAAPGSRRQP